MANPAAMGSMPISSVGRTSGTERSAPRRRGGAEIFAEKGLEKGPSAGPGCPVTAAFSHAEEAEERAAPKMPAGRRSWPGGIERSAPRRRGGAEIFAEKGLETGPSAGPGRPVTAEFSNAEGAEIRATPKVRHAVQALFQDLFPSFRSFTEAMNLRLLRARSPVVSSAARGAETLFSRSSAKSPRLRVSAVRLMPAVSRSQARRGVTLIEMLVVMAIIGVIVGISMPSVAAGIDSVRLASATDAVAAFLNAAVNSRGAAGTGRRGGHLAQGKPAGALFRSIPVRRTSCTLPDGIAIEAVLPAPQEDTPTGRRLHSHARRRRARGSESSSAIVTGPPDGETGPHDRLSARGKRRIKSDGQARIHAAGDDRGHHHHGGRRGDPAFRHLAAPRASPHGCAITTGWCNWRACA